MIGWWTSDSLDKSVLLSLKGSSKVSMTWKNTRRAHRRLQGVLQGPYRLDGNLSYSEGSGYTGERGKGGLRKGGETKNYNNTSSRESVAREKSKLRTAKMGTARWCHGTVSRSRTSTISYCFAVLLFEQPIGLRPAINFGGKPIAWSANQLLQIVNLYTGLVERSAAS